ncbi:MAG: cupin domain-containing protein [Azospirillum sp.]|nr:cupin domain-containing protein [Azospirillum sp.]
MTRTTDVFIKGDDAPWVDLGGGLRRQLLGYQSAIMMARIAFEAGAVGALHSHRHVQCSYVESGVFEVTIGGRSQRLVAGDGYLVPSGAEHGAIAIEPGILVDVFTPMRDDFLA